MRLQVLHITRTVPVALWQVRRRFGAGPAPPAHSRDNHHSPGGDHTARQIITFYRVKGPGPKPVRRDCIGDGLLLPVTGRALASALQ